MTLSKLLIYHYFLNGFLTVLPPRTAVNGGNLKLTKKYSEKAFQNCLQFISTPKIKEDMTFSKTGTKNFNLELEQIYIERERERERETQTKRIFGVDGFEFYEVF